MIFFCFCSHFNLKNWKKSQLPWFFWQILYKATYIFSLTPLKVQCSAQISGGAVNRTNNPTVHGLLHLIFSRPQPFYFSFSVFSGVKYRNSHQQEADFHINKHCCGLISGISEHLNTCERCITVLINGRPQLRSVRRRRSAQFIYPKREEGIL